MSSRCGPSPVTPRSRSRSSRASSAATVRRLAVVAELRLGEAELAGALGERRRRAARALPCERRRAAVPSAATCSVHGASASRVEKPPATRRSDALRCATAAPYSAGSCARAGDEPAERAVEVRAARGRRALDDAEAVGCEDERRRLAAQLLGRAQRRAVQLRALAGAGLERQLDLERHRARASRAPRSRAARSPKRISCASVRVRGEKPCVPDVQRLEQVRLADAVRADREHEAGPQARARAARTTGSRERSCDDQVVRSARAGGSA